MSQSLLMTWLTFFYAIMNAVLRINKYALENHLAVVKDAVAGVGHLWCCSAIFCFLVSCHHALKGHTRGKKVMPAHREHRGDIIHICADCRWQ